MGWFEEQQQGDAPGPPPNPDNPVPDQPPGAPAPGGGTGSTSAWFNPQDPQGSFQRLTQHLGLSRWSTENMQALAPYLEAIGGRLENPNARGQRTKIILPGNQIYRVGNDDGSWAWVSQQGLGPSPGGGDFGAPPEYTGLERPDYLKGAYVAPTFTAPTLQDLQTSPGYQAGADLQQKGFERSAASRGTLLSGGTQVALGKALGDYASTKYGDLFNQHLQAFGANAGFGFQARNFNENAYQSDVGNAYNQYLQRYGAYRNRVKDAQWLADLGARANSNTNPGGTGAA